MLQQHAHCAGATAIIQLIIFVAYIACWVCLCCHNPLNSDMDYRTFIVRTDVNACNCMQGVYGHWKRVCTESWLWEENLLLHMRTEPESVAFRSDAITNWATSHINLYEMCNNPYYLDSLNFLASVYFTRQMNCSATARYLQTWTDWPRKWLGDLTCCNVSSCVA